MQDTIIAVSTSSGRSLHAIIRISGSEAISSITGLFSSNPALDLNEVPTYTTIHGHLYSTEESVAIPVVLYIMKFPYSYTKEDIVEIHTFGSPPVLEMLLRTILSKGSHEKRTIRLAQPGEFTKRAFLHGRIDLAQAEATMRIIRAQTDGELRVAVAHLTGDTSLQIKRLREEMISLCSQIEAAIDFFDQDIELLSEKELMNGLEMIEKNTLHLLSQAEKGKLVLEGIDTVLFGKPNVGKSSLINALLEKERVIVSHISGTTRDIVTDVLGVEGVQFKLKDTAGIDKTSCAVMIEAMGKARAHMEGAQIIVLVFDVNVDIREQWQSLLLNELPENVIVVMNKCDLQKNSHDTELPIELKPYPVIYTSVVTGEGIESLKETFVKSVLENQVKLLGHHPIFTVRQRGVLQRSLQSIHQAIESLKNAMSYECIASDIRTALDILGEIGGEVTTEDILDEIFSGFCIGK